MQNKTDCRCPECKSERVTVAHVGKHTGSYRCLDCGQFFKLVYVMENEGTNGNNNKNG
jgi:DNA-directed RNA polymerase subunit RPC12/RpoP